MNEAILSMWVITANPSDHPGKFVMREHMIFPGLVLVTANHQVCDSIDEARNHVPRGTFMLPRQQNDDPVIVESWI